MGIGGHFHIWAFRIIHMRGEKCTAMAIMQMQMVAQMFPNGFFDYGNLIECLQWYMGATSRFTIFLRSNGEDRGVHNCFCIFF